MGKRKRGRGAYLPEDDETAHGQQSDWHKNERPSRSSNRGKRGSGPITSQGGNQPHHTHRASSRTAHFSRSTQGTTAMKDTNPERHSGRSKQSRWSRHWRGGSDARKCSASSSAASGRHASNQSADSGNSSNELEIPGFYYDPVKKKYFKILPGHQSANNTMVTKETIKLKKTEEARQQSLREFALQTIKMDPSYADTNTHRPRCQYSNNIVDHVHSIHTGAVPTHERRLFEHTVINRQLQNLQSFCKQKVFPREERGTAYKRLEHMTQICMCPGDEWRVLGLWSLDGLIVQRIQLLNIKPLTRDETGGSMTVMPTGAVLLQSFSKVTHMCLAPSSVEQTTNIPVLYTTTCFIGNSPSLALLRTLEDEGHPNSASYTEFHLGPTTTWTCAWSTQKKKFSIGTKDSSLILDVATRRLWEMFTRKSDVYTQTFNHADGNMLYSGTKKGVILGHDLRSNSTRYVTELNHKSPICHLHLLKNDVHLLASDFSGKLCMWDLRKRKVVMDYLGHNNEYARLPFHVDHDTESTICAVGQDCYTRLWDLQSSRLLTSIPPPYPASRDLTPSVALYTARHGQANRPGVLMGIKDELHYYSAF